MDTIVPHDRFKSHRTRRMVREEVQKIMPKCAICRHYSKLDEKRMGFCEMTRKPKYIVATIPEFVCEKWEEVKWIYQNTGQLNWNPTMNSCTDFFGRPSVSHAGTPNLIKTGLNTDPAIGFVGNLKLMSKTTSGVGIGRK